MDPTVARVNAILAEAFGPEYGRLIAGSFRLAQTVVNLIAQAEARQQAAAEAPAAPDKNQSG